MVIADITSTVFCDPHGLRYLVLAYHSFVSQGITGPGERAHAEPPYGASLGRPGMVGSAAREWVI